ncbi:unnamed protein product [Cylindrotheca closterium]|uniref:Uncharacterized protein n=1 Tax=Cylindrotheca closterium TaxID=2856 RepID=A0AAD2FTN9_9STRA|nr:unnamed protein product [Cylindrotheca closterium]
MSLIAKNIVKALLYSFLLLALAQISHADKERSDDNNSAKIPATLLSTALNYAVQSGLGEGVVQRVYDKNIDALYRVAKSMYANPRQNQDEDDKLTSVQIFHALADGEEHHILSMIQLGFAYAEEDKSQAIQYFVQAGEDGPHQASLYNAGRLFAEEGEFAAALGYMRAAVSLPDSNSEYSSDKMTDTAKAGYNSLNIQLQQVELGLNEMVAIFPYADLKGFPQEGSKADKLWNEAMTLFESFGKNKKISDLEACVKKLSDFQMQHDKNMTALQTSLLRRILTTALDIMSNEL